MSELRILSSDFDGVIKSHFISAKSTYSFAIEKLVPAIDRLTIQRSTQNQKFYERLGKDILRGCIMPPLTIALVSNDFDKKSAGEIDWSKELNDRSDDFFVLDGIQRLNTLKRIYSEAGNKFPEENPIFLNVLICNSFDLLLYRMITLNNGQKAMSARHQIEVIADNIYDFEGAPLNILQEKKIKGQIRKKGAFKKADLVKAYLAFLSQSVNIDNSKIIEEKMDEIIARRIVESDITESEVDFDDVLAVIEKFIKEPEVNKFLTQENNLIGFCAGARNSIDSLNSMDVDDFKESKELFERAFSQLNPSKIKVGLARRECLCLFVSKIAILNDKDEYDLAEEFSRML
ncbi:hypothetical protein ACI51Z_13450 [Pectobacterium carotovorum]|uniref:hypothetical protein n=1 Tax=Pectobacterium TaxID=122277 RepID=UPI00057F2219|nr:MULTISPECIES: hypothetical protein [Pectobacterium]KHS99959.1 hypothetical protein RC88_01470 [Pectobacterium parvum]